MSIKNHIIKISKPTLLTILAIVLIPVMSVSAATLGTLRRWSSDWNQVGRWGSTVSTIPTSIYISKLNSSGTFYFASGMDSGISKWNSAMGISMKSVAYVSGSVPVLYYGGTISQINALGITTLTAGTTGYNKITSTNEGAWAFGSYLYSGMKMSKDIGFIVDRGAYDSSVYVNTCMHELGHTIGWIGHAPSNTDVMYAYNDLINLTLTLTDKDQVLQVYGK